MSGAIACVGSAGLRFFFFQAEDGIRDHCVTGVQTCALPICEVRNLAQRSAQAAREIKQLIATSATRVKQGTELADQAGATMAEVLHSIQRVTEIGRASCRERV